MIKYRSSFAFNCDATSQHMAVYVRLLLKSQLQGLVFLRLLVLISALSRKILEQYCNYDTTTSTQILSYSLVILSLIRFTLGTESIVEWSEFLATNPEVLGSISGTTRFSEKS
jgi:hypothetical protein